MTRWKKETWIFWAAWLCICSPAMVRAQVSNQNASSVNSIRAKQDSTLRVMADSLATLGDEIELLEINIEAVIEKPRVSILPKRIEPALGEMDFVDRSFESELKQVPEKPMVTDERLYTPKKIENLKAKLLSKKRELEKK